MVSVVMGFSRTAVIMAVLMMALRSGLHRHAPARGDDTTPANWATKNRATSKRTNRGMVRNKFMCELTRRRPKLLPL